MTDHREVMRQALEALELDAYGEPSRHERNKAIKALRSALDDAGGDVEPAGCWSRDAAEWLRRRYGSERGHPEWRALLEAFDAGWNAHPPTPTQDADTVTVRLTREQHEHIRWTVEQFSIDPDELLDALGAFPDAGQG